MSRNVTILVVILVILLIAGYLLWLRGRFQADQTPQTPVSTQETINQNPQPTIASVSGTSNVTATPSARPTVSTRTSTSSGKVVK